MTLIYAATGHRPEKLGGHSPQIDDRLRDLARRFLAAQRPEKVISGMALGWDMAWAEAALWLGIPLIAAVPCERQDRFWPGPSQRRYRQVLELAAEVVVLSPTYSRHVMQMRNEWMVDRASQVIALWDGSTGGTGNCIRYAEAKRVPIWNLWPQWCGQL